MTRQSVGVSVVIRLLLAPRKVLNKPFPVPQSHHSGSPASSGLAVTREGSQDSPDFPLQ